MENTSQIDLKGNISDFSATIKALETEPGKSIQVQKLYKTKGMEILLIALDGQAELKKHTAPGPISVQVIRGSISFRTDESAKELTTGQLLTLEGNVPHSVFAAERSIFLVTKSIPG
ncbi:MAG: cupin domain-containing protein [Pedobacter sp.]|uniref:cupin domain-containing protein n=1 Tax=Pedobacter sp. TaxID=1411316 RepID=UPI003563C189